MSALTADQETEKSVYIGRSPFEGRFAQSGVNAVLTITLNASTHPARPSFEYVHWSYSATPSGATLTITDGDVTAIYYITSGGPGFLPFDGAAFTSGNPVTVTLTAGGAGISSSLAVIGARDT